MEQFDGLQDLASHLGVIFNIDKPCLDKEIPFNEGHCSTKIFSECEDHTNSDCLIGGQKNQGSKMFCELNTPNVGSSKANAQLDVYSW